MNSENLKQQSLLYVYKNQFFAGTLSRTEWGSTFEYDSKYLEKISEDIAFHLSCSQKMIETRGVNLHPFFAGLLPEGIRLKALLRQLKTSEDDLFTLLLASGIDPIGDVSIQPQKSFRIKTKPCVDLKQISQISFLDILQKSLETLKPESLFPGIQEKISASMISLPIRSFHKNKSYILKLNPPDKPYLVENEFFFLRMAKACELQTVSAQLIFDKNKTPGLLVERFDRIPTKEGRWNKFHQEDACQFLNRYPADKYNLSFSEIAKGFQKWCSAPIVEIAKLIQLKIFSYLIGNGDLHAKNISLIKNIKTRRIEMSPVYDLLSTTPYGDQKMALPLDGRNDNLKRKNFIEFGKRFEVAPRAIEKMIDKTIKLSKPWMEKIDLIGLPRKETLFLKKTMKKRFTDLQKG